MRVFFYIITSKSTGVYYFFCFTEAGKRRLRRPDYEEEAWIFTDFIQEKFLTRGISGRSYRERRGNLPDFRSGASRVSLIGEFNGWEETTMRRVSDGNFWECHIDSAGEGMMYKYRIYDRSGKLDRSL